ncbi:MAG: exodeoxyribonuclease VII small subunit [Gammaproteobacteria bacterium]
MMAKPKKKEELDFEAALSDLAVLIDQMEHGQLPLEKALENFERGITLVRQCQGALKKAEQKVQILIEKAGKQTLEPYDNNNTA